MKRMVTEEEIIDLIEKYAPPLDPSTIEEGNVPQDAILGIEEGEIVKGNLFGKYVHISEPPTLPLTPEQLELFSGGVFINGEFLGLKNPIIFPFSFKDEEANTTETVIFGTSGAASYYGNVNLRTLIVGKNGNMQTTNTGIFFENASTYAIQLRGVNAFNSKTVPYYPSDTTKRYAFEQNIGGNLAWYEVINNIAPEFDSTTTYTENALVMYQGTLYACTNAAGHTGNWDAADFTRKYISEVI